MTIKMPVHGMHHMGIDFFTAVTDGIVRVDVAG